MLIPSKNNISMLGGNYTGEWQTFISSVEKTRRQLKLRRTDKTITKIIEEECKKGRNNANELKGGSRRRKVSTVRARIAKRGVDELGLSMAEIARHVGVTTSSIAKAVARLEEEGGL